MVLLIKTPEGQYALEALIVAVNRANYYANVDGIDVGSREWRDEVDNVMNDEYELVDWLFNNINWVDIQHHVSLVDANITCSTEDFWSDYDTVKLTNNKKV